MIQISSIEELQEIGNNPDFPLDAEYELTQDINASKTINWNDGAGFIPIGSSGRPFTGRFDGKNYKITGLYINRYNECYIGLFGYMGSCSEVKNICLENLIIVGNYYVGGLVGWNWGTISGCYSTGTILGEWYVGGLVGENRGDVERCYSMGSVYGIGKIGGLIGDNISLVSGCYSTGSVYGKKEVGGLIGENLGDVSNSYVMGLVIGSFKTGGLIGYLENGNVINTYSTGLIGGYGRYKGGLIGYIELINNPKVTSSYWNIETSRITYSEGGKGKTTAKMKQQSTFNGWDFTNLWGIVEYKTYPYLLWQNKGDIEWNG